MDFEKFYTLVRAEYDSRNTLVNPDLALRDAAGAMYEINRHGIRNDPSKYAKAAVEIFIGGMRTGERGHKL